MRSTQTTRSSPIRSPTLREGNIVNATIIAASAGNQFVYGASRFARTAGGGGYGCWRGDGRRRFLLAALLALLVADPAGAAERAGSTETDQEDAEAQGLFPLREPDEDPTEYHILAPNEPIYFVAGGNGDTTARFQLSFQYRLFDAGSSLVRRVPWTSGLHLGYTQTSLWNLSADSKPFEDTSYRPSLFWQTFERREGLLPDALRVGYEHESNGRSEEESRSLDTLFVHPAWFHSLGRYQLTIAPKLHLYLAKGGENPDIADYRGYAGLLARYGRTDGWQVSARLRTRKGGYASGRLDFSYPLRSPVAVFARTGGYFYVQLFHGYGESLLNYDQKEDLQVRIGLSIVR